MKDRLLENMTDVDKLFVIFKHNPGAKMSYMLVCIYLHPLVLSIEP